MAAKKKTAAAKKAGEEAPSFEDAMREVEGIVEALEGDDVPLEELLERYERGTALIRVCQERIAEAEARVELIAKRAGGGVDAVPFDGDDGDAENDAEEGGEEGEIQLL